MGYRNDNTGYRDDILQNRSVVKRNWAVIEPDGCVKNVIPGFENCDVTILGSPKLGGTFVDYLLTVHEGGKNAQGWGQPGEELFIYFFDGTVEVSDGETTQTVTDDGYIFVPEGKKIFFENKGAGDAHGFMYKRLYDRIEGHEAHTVIGNSNDLEWVDYEDMTDVKCCDFLPSATDLGFDMTSTSWPLSRARVTATWKPTSRSTAPTSSPARACMCSRTSGCPSRRVITSTWALTARRPPTVSAATRTSPTSTARTATATSVSKSLLDFGVLLSSLS